MNYYRRENIFHQKIDHAGAFFQLINNFKSSYILTELIQNELDARSTDTTIEFLEDRIISRGNGNKIDNNGWDRLTFLYGAGSEILSKKNSIGKKNYGLRSCFTISDKVIVRSNQLHSIIEIYRQEGKPKPEAFIKPLKDITAPSKGTAIEILYRTEDLKVIVGENFNFLAPDNNKKEFLFDDACNRIPKNFIGVLRPTILPKYSITLNHWQKGSTTFFFECKKTKRNYNIDIFTRTCTKISGNKKIVIIKEEFFEFYLNISDLNKHKLPWALSRNKKAIADIAWEINGKKNLNCVDGIRRYPIAFFNNKSSEVLTDLGIHFTGPYAPSSERDVPTDQVINSYIDDVCKKKFYSIFKKYLFPKYSSSCLNLCISNNDKENLNYKKLSPLILNLVNKGMIPVTKSEKDISVKQTLNSPKLKPYSFIIPTYRWEKGEFSKDLSKIAPNEFFQIHKSIPKEILSILYKIIFDQDIKKKIFMTFDEIDAFDRMTDTNKIFPWKSKKEQINNLSDLSILKLYFGNINKIWERKNINDYSRKKFKEIRQNILLPDSNNELYKIKLLNQSQIKINHIPGFNQKILNYDISNHSIIKKLKIKKFDINNYLQQLTLKNFTTKKIFNNFFNWLDANHNDFTKKSLNYLFQLSIWPTSSGQFVPFDKICSVKNKNSLKLLGSIIVSPNKDLINFSQKNKWIKLRKNLKNQECVNYFTSSFDKILVEHNSDISKLKDLILNFEKNLEYLINDKNLNFKISENIDSLHFFNKEGKSKFIKDLYLLNKNDYNIPKKYLILSSNKIFKKFGVSTKLAASAMHDTIVNHQTDSIKILSKRINYLNEFKDQDISNLSKENIIPFNKEYYSPNKFKIKGTIDYWGKWKIDHHDINVLSALERGNFVKAGVYRQYSGPEQTISFFNWLQKKSNKMISDHIKQIINHWKEYKDWSNIPALPVQNHKGELDLVTIKEAVNEKNKIVISDFIQLENEMKKKQTSFRFIYFLHQNRKIIDINFLKEKNINLLNSIAKIEKIHNKSVLKDLDLQNMLVDKLKHIQSSKIIKQLSQRLIEKDFPGKLNHAWKAKILKIKKIIITEKLEIIYSLKREQYVIKKDHFLDKNNIVYINYQSSENYDQAFYQLIAENIFINHKRYFGAALKDAVEMDFKSRKSVRSKIPNTDEENYSKGEEDNNLGGKPTSRIPQHPGRKLKQQGPSNNPRLKAKEKKSKNKKSFSIRNKEKLSSPEQEKQDVSWLKKEQYAYHCQACLGSKDPKNLAPKGTYSYEQIHRQEFMAHHHVTFKGPEAGQREAGNILILCYNHHNGLKPISDKITRKLILTKFKKNDFEEVIRTFSETEKDQIIKGKVISIDLVTGEKLKLFFREDHLRLFINLKD